MRNGKRSNAGRHPAIATGAGDGGDDSGLISTIEQDFTLTGQVSSDDGAEESGFAAATGADEGEELAAGDGQIDIAQHFVRAEPVVGLPGTRVRWRWGI